MFEKISNDAGEASVDNDGKDSNKFEILFGEVEKELYLGSEKFLSRNFLVILMHLKVLNKWSNNSFDMLRKLLKNAFLEGMRIPRSHYETKTLLRNLGL